MKSLVFTLFLFICMCQPIYSQSKIKLHDKKFSHEIESEFKEGKYGESTAAFRSTYIGNYQQAINYYSLPLAWNLDTISHADSLEFLEYNPISAFEYISDLSKNEELIIISEAHHLPQHRLFTKSLLEKLYANGFRHLGLEALTPHYEDSTKFMLDTLLNDRGYPLNSYLTGLFVQEPQMGNLIREAIQLGFKIFGYEELDKGVERDLQQAKNIEKYMNANPDGKIVIHCGWYHAIESNYPKRKNDNWMAYHLKQNTGINPLTIYQDALSEKFTIEESPYYKMIDSDEVSVLTNGDKIFNGFGDKKHFDIFVYHPPTKYRKNRPHWLFQSEDAHFAQIDKERINKDDYPVIVEAFPVGEEYSVPIDVIELQNENDSGDLILKKGEYLIRIMNINREFDEYELKIE